MSKGLEISFMKAKTAEKRGDLAEAEQLYAAILAQFPNNVRARRGMEAVRQQRAGDMSPPESEVQALTALYNAGNWIEAIERSERLVAQYPQAFILHTLLGEANNRLQRLDQAADWFRKATRIKPDSVEAHYNLGSTLQTLGRSGEAIASYEEAIRLKPDYAEAHNNLGATLQSLRRMDEAIACHVRAIEIKADYGLAHYNLGRALQAKGEMEKAIASYERAIALHPPFAEAYNSLGRTLQALGRPDEAIASYQASIRLRPDYVEAHNNLGVSLQTLGRLDEAIASYERALRIMPTNTAANTQKLLQQAYICDWEGFRSKTDIIPLLGVEGSATSPFAMLSMEDQPERHRIRSEKYAAEYYPLFERYPGTPPKTKPERLRIGYFSADFHNHATMYLLARMFELHDSTRFEVHAFSYGPDRDDEMRQRLIGAVDKFHDVRALNDSEVVELARREGIDVAIDLKGYTHGERVSILALRPAPVQVGYMGYPGTWGAPFIDYIVADKVVVPDVERRHVAEKIIYLPDCYFVNDDSRQISDRMPTRAEAGLPAQGFVFCCFNNNYKISPVEFDIWMRLLHRVDGSVLWLLRANQWAERNLRTEAQRHGIDADRLVFADRIPLAEHLARHRLADLFLDTFNVNAHTTASDALWAGLPVVTKIGRGFAARVAGSLLAAVGMPELITATPEDYERLALELARSSQKLAGIKEKLASNRLTAPLFNTELFTRHIETAYEQIYAAYLAGDPPTDIMIGQGMEAVRQRQAGGADASLPEAEVQALTALYNAGKWSEAVERSERLVAQYPQAFILHTLLGEANNRLQRLDQAADWFRKATRIQPDSAEAHYNLGSTLQTLGDFEGAIASYERAIASKPDFAEAYNNLGASLQALGRMDEAIPRHEQAIGIRPDYGLAHFNLGKALQRLGRPERAIPYFERAIEIRPNFVEAYNDLGVALQEVGQLTEAIASYAQALHIMPDNAAARSRKLLQHAHNCDWEPIQSDMHLVPILGIIGGVASPFAMISFEDYPEHHRIRAEKYTAEIHKLSDSLANLQPRVRPARLRIGYFSADFHDHPVMYLMARMLELHDRGRFEIHAFSYAPGKNDEMRQRLQEAVDTFHDVQSMGSKSVAELARQEEIDIAVDLQGFTGNSRLDIFAWRAAPVQISYLAYPSSLGAPFIDYLIADRVVIPEAQREHYSEKVIFLPDSYMVHDDTRIIPDRMMSRADAGLPENGFVFCCFNNNYKISPAEFDIWMRLLHRVEGSVLWMRQTNGLAEGNLRKEAQKRGIDADRLIFAGRVPWAEHLTRHRLADLFLDTFNYNAHTTANDALWAGLPVLTKLGQGFAARVGGSLLNAIGLPELITSTAEDYERLALELALDTQKLARIRERLASNRLTAPLFNTDLFTRHIEAAYEQAYERYMAGKDPADIVIGQDARAELNHHLV